MEKVSFGEREHALNFSEGEGEGEIDPEREDARPMS